MIFMGEWNWWMDGWIDGPGAHFLGFVPFAAVKEVGSETPWWCKGIPSVLQRLLG